MFSREDPAPLHSPLPPNKRYISEIMVGFFLMENLGLLYLLSAFLGTFMSIFLSFSLQVFYQKLSIIPDHKTPEMDLKEKCQYHKAHYNVTTVDRSVRLESSIIIEHKKPLHFPTCASACSHILGQNSDCIV